MRQIIKAKREKIKEKPTENQSVLAEEYVSQRLGRDFKWLEQWPSLLENLMPRTQMTYRHFGRTSEERRKNTGKTKHDCKGQRWTYIKSGSGEEMLSQMKS